MRAFDTLLTLLASAGFVRAAAGFQYFAAATSWWAYYVGEGNGLMSTAYTTCREHRTGATGATGSECMGKATAFVFESTGITFFGGYIFAAIKGPGATKTRAANPPSRLMVQRVMPDHHFRLLDRLNKHFGVESGLQAIGILRSHLHPDDGLAIRMSVHSDDTTLHVHTNGTHAMTIFDKDDPLEKRVLSKGGKHFQFSGIAGIKFQAHIINPPPAGDFASDVNKFTTVFTKSNPGYDSIMEQHNEWRIEVCNKQQAATFFNSKFEVKGKSFTKEYEPLAPPGCH